MNISKMFDLTGKVALVTGGAGLYGRQIVEGLAEAGATVWIASRNLPAIESFAADLRRRKFDIRSAQLDLSLAASMGELVQNIVQVSGKLDILVNNAVTRCAIPAGWAAEPEQFDASFHTNASALFFLTRLCAEEMKKHRSGSIINIASYQGMVGPDPRNYVGTAMFDNPSPIYFYEKAGMINFTRWAAVMLGPDNIRVNSLSPGGYHTQDTPSAFEKNYVKSVPLERLADDDDLKGAVVFLASYASRYITGSNLPVDGGYTAK